MPSAAQHASMPMVSVGGLPAFCGNALPPTSNTMHVPRLQIVVRIGPGEIVLRVDHAAAFKAHHLQAGIDQFNRDDRAGNSDAYNNCVNGFEFGDEAYSQCFFAS